VRWDVVPSGREAEHKGKADSAINELAVYE